MTTFLTALDAATIDWSRAQFALTACYHWLFVPHVGTSTYRGDYGDALLYEEGRVLETRHSILDETLRH